MITFTPAFAGPKNIYVNAQNATFTSSWTQLGTWIVPYVAPPAPESLSPSSGTGTSQTFAAVFSDGSTTYDLIAAHVVIGTSMSPSNSCFIYYSNNAGAERLYLSDDSGGLQSGIALGSPGTLSNSQCSLNVGASSRAASNSFAGSRLTLNLAVTFSPNFAGAKNVYLNVQSTTISSPWVQMGTWTIPGSVSISPSLSSGKAASQSSTLTPGQTDASKAVDGNADGSYPDGSLTHTNLDSNPWWQVDLGSSASISSIVVWNRTDCCGNRLTDFWVFVSDTPFLSSDTPASLQSRAATFSSHQTSMPNPSSSIVISGAQGRYVRIQLSSAGYLSLAEVQVFGH